jgi:hypothetical protein
MYYWTSVAPLVRVELRRWEERAKAIPDDQDRGLALRKLAKEGLNARAGAILATLAPRAQRERAVEAIVAGQVLFDYLDGLTELPAEDPLAEGERLFEAFTSAFDLSPSPTVPGPPIATEGGYLWELSRVTQCAFAQLPAATTVAGLAREAAEWSAQAQTHMHATPALGRGQLEEWSREQGHRTGLGWREALAGSASSVLVVHALVVAATDPATTTARAQALAWAYLRVCVVLTLLDSLVDRDEDEREGRDGYAGLYAGANELARTLGEATRSAREQTRALPDGGHHEAMLAGVAAYFGTLPGAKTDFARPVMATVNKELQPTVTPARAVMGAWRLARRARALV